MARERKAVCARWGFTLQSATQWITPFVHCARCGIVTHQSLGPSLLRRNGDDVLPLLYDQPPLRSINKPRHYKDVNAADSCCVNATLQFVIERLVRVATRFTIPPDACEILQTLCHTLLCSLHVFCNVIPPTCL